MDRDRDRMGNAAMCISPTVHALAEGTGCCGTREFHKLHALELEQFDSVALLDTDVDILGALHTTAAATLRTLLDCAASGYILSTRGIRLLQRWSVGIPTECRPQRTLIAELTRAQPSAEGAWNRSGWGPFGSKPYYGAFSWQGFAYWAFYQSDLLRRGSFPIRAAQLDPCVWNLQVTSALASTLCRAATARIHHAAQGKGVEHSTPRSTLQRTHRNARVVPHSSEGCTSGDHPHARKKYNHSMRVASNVRRLSSRAPQHNANGRNTTLPPKEDACAEALRWKREAMRLAGSKDASSHHHRTPCKAANMEAAEADAIWWRKEAGRLSCEQRGIGPTGGFCMIGEKAAGGTNGCLPTGVASRLASLFAHRSVVDLGCGVGQYGRYFKENASNVHWVGVDGAEMVEEATNGLVRFADLSVGLPSWLVRSKRPDWVMSIEVIEHVPREHEAAFLFNLISLRPREGILLSWARPSQPGFHHVNCQTIEYASCVMSAAGYQADEPLSTELRSIAEHSECRWLRRTLMAFRTARHAVTRRRLSRCIRGGGEDAMRPSASLASLVQWTVAVGCGALTL